MDTLQNSLAEMGYQLNLPPAIGSMPAGMGRFAVPHAHAFSAMWNTASRTYPQAFDEAVRDSRQNALAIRRDAVVDAAMRHLVMPICQQSWQLAPRRPDDPQLKADAELLTRLIRNLCRPGFHQLVRILAESRFFGRYGAQFSFTWGWDDYQRVMYPDAFAPVHGDKIVFKYASNQPGILVNQHSYPGPTVPTERGACHFLDAREQEQFTWAEFNPEDADFYESQFAGQIHGLGFRSKLYWPWWLREQILQQTLRFLKRAANGYTVGFFDANNPAAEARLAAKLRAYTGDDFILFPRDRQEHSPYGLDHTPIPLHGSNIFMDLIRWINDIIRDYILGEDLTTNAESTGMNNSTAEAHETTADMRTKYHAADIRVALQPLVKTLARYNCPGRPAPDFEWLAEKRNPLDYMEALDFAYQHGLAVEEDDVRDVLGLPSPREGKSVLAAMVPGQPAGVMGQPQGVPQAMPAGPMGGGGMQQYSRMSRRGRRELARTPGIIMRNGQLYSTRA